MQTRKEVQRRSIPPRRVETRLDGCRSITRDLLNEPAAKKRAAGFDRLQTLDIHRVALAVLKDQKCVWIDEGSAATGDPFDLAADDTLDRKGTREVGDDVSSRSRMKDKIILAES